MTAPDGTVTAARSSRYEGRGPYRGMVFFPRLSWKLDENNELNLSAGLQADSSSWGGASHNIDTVGGFGDPDWTDSTSHSRSSHWMARSEINWVAKLGGGKLELTASAERSRKDSDQASSLATSDQAIGLARDWDDVKHNSRAFVRGKFSRTMFDDHALATGIEASRQDNDEWRYRHERQTQLAPTDVVEEFDPRIMRMAGYVQDEWNILPQWSMYLGGRREGIETDSAASGQQQATVSRNHVLSPVTQTLYKLPGGKQQLRLDLDPDGRWLYQPFNDGDATVRSLEAELKLPLQLVIDAARNIDLRASLTRIWSEVSTVPGPGNRLDAQTPESASFGVDYRRDMLSLGASLAYQQGGWVRISDAQSSLQQTRKDLDAYALWKLDPHFQLRLSLANLLGMDNTSERSYEDASGTSRQWSYQPGWTRVGLNLEMKL